MSENIIPYVGMPEYVRDWIRNFENSHQIGLSLGYHEFHRDGQALLPIIHYYEHGEYIYVIQDLQRSEKRTKTGDFIGSRDATIHYTLPSHNDEHGTLVICYIDNNGIAHMLKQVFKKSRS